MRFRGCFIMALLLLSGAVAQAQTGLSEGASLPSAGSDPASGPSLLQIGSFSGAESHPFSTFRLPSHVRTNPRGYSPLCRLELRIEDELPVGMWLKLGDRPLNPTYLRSNAEVRFKLFRF